MKKIRILLSVVIVLTCGCSQNKFPNSFGLKDSEQIVHNNSSQPASNEAGWEFDGSVPSFAYETSPVDPIVIASIEESNKQYPYGNKFTTFRDYIFYYTNESLSKGGAKIVYEIPGGESFTIFESNQSIDHIVWRSAYLIELYMISRVHLDDVSLDVYQLDIRTGELITSEKGDISNRGQTYCYVNGQTFLVTEIGFDPKYNIALIHEKGQTEQIITQADYYLYDENGIYYILFSSEFTLNSKNEATLWKVNIDDKSDEKLYSFTTENYYLKICGDYFIHMDSPDSLAFYDIKNQKELDFTHTISGYIMYYDGTNFYINQNGNLVCFNLNGESNIILESFQGKIVFVFNDWIYYEEQEKKPDSQYETDSIVKLYKIKIEKNNH